MPFPSSGQISASTINSNLGNSSNTEIKFSNTLVSLAAGQFPAAQSAVDLKFSNFYFTQSLSNTALLFASDKSGNDSNEGTSSAMSADGRTLAVGMASDSTAGQFNGAAAVYFLTNNVWTQQGYNPSTGGPQNIITPAGVIGTQISFGSSVALSADGNTLAVGGPDDNSQIGAVWIFTRSSSIWTQQGSKLIGTGGDKARQGNSLALSADGNTLVVGGPNDRIGVNPNFTLVGATWVFTRSGSTWTQQGSKLVGTGWVGNEVRQGISVSLSSDGNTLAIGAFFDNGQVGATWIFTRSGSTWTQQGSKLVGTGATGSSWQGYDTELSSDGNVLLIGGPFDNSFAGAIWMFTRTGTTWTQIGSKVVNGAGTSFGNSLGLSKTGNTLGIGMPGYSRPFATAGGAELVYR